MHKTLLLYLMMITYILILSLQQVCKVRKYYVSFAKRKNDLPRATY